MLLIVVDTLRADVMGTHGFPAETTPFIDEWSRDAVVFRSCRSSAPWTVPSVASIFTGWHPVGIAAQPPPGGPAIARSKLAIPTEAETLAESFSQAGWSTAAFIANPWLAQELGFHRGFDHIEDSLTGLPDDNDAVVFQQAAQWLTKRSGDRRPWFAYVHLMGVHGPYDAPETDVEAIDQQAHGLPNRVLDSAEWDALPDYLLKLDWTSQPEAHELRTWWIRYAAGVRRFDRQLAEFMNILDDQSAVNNAIVVLTSDHGEELADHGKWDHGLSLFDHQLRVPLMIRLPGSTSGVTIDNDVSLVDLAPTLRTAAGLPERDPDPRDDFSLLVEEPESDRRQQPVLASGVKYLPHMHTTVHGNTKLIENMSTQEVWLFDLAADPGETTNLSNADPARTKDLRIQLRNTLASRVALGQIPPPGSPEVTEERRRMLKALGYSDSD